MGGNTTVEAPAPVDPAKVGADSLETQLRLAPQVLAAEQQYRPEYARLQQQLLEQSMPGLLSLYGTAANTLGQQQITANTQQRMGDIADVERLGGQARQAYYNANPELMTEMAGLSSRIAAARNVTPLMGELKRSATEAMTNGGNLSTSELADAQQTARSAYAARGLNDSNAAIGAEVLMTDQARTNKLNNARQFALGVDQYDRAVSSDQFAREFNLANMYQSQAQDPFQMVLGRSGVTQQAMGATSQAGGYTQGGAQLFDPFNSSLMNIYAGNTANQLAANTATANNQANMGGAALGAGGTIIGGALVMF